MYVLLKSLKIIAAVALLSSPLSFNVKEAEARTCVNASYYGNRFHGRLQANGRPFNMNAMTTAHRSLPFGTRLKVTDPNTGRSAIVTVTDRGPYVAGRSLDLSKAAFNRIFNGTSRGVGRVCYTRLN